MVPMTLLKKYMRFVLEREGDCQTFVPTVNSPELKRIPASRRLSSADIELLQKVANEVREDERRVLI